MLRQRRRRIHAAVDRLPRQKNAPDLAALLLLAMPLLRVMAGSRSPARCWRQMLTLLRAADPHGCLLVDHGRVGPLSGEMVRGERCQRHLRRCLQDTDHPDHPRHGFYGRLALSAIAESGDRRAQARLRARVGTRSSPRPASARAASSRFSPLLIRLLAAESYYDAWRYIPILTLSMIAAAFSNPFMGSVYVVTKEEHGIALDLTRRRGGKHRTRSVPHSAHRRAGRARRLPHSSAACSYS